MAPTRHELYYMKDGVSFLVDNTLFKVPRYMLENTSPTFRAMLSEVQPGSDPISLPGVSSEDFERLLTFLYPLAPQVDTLSKPWDEHQWTAILRLATMWEMTEIRTVAMRLLSQIRSPFTKITLGREYGHSPWLREGFIMLCLRPEPITADEAVQLTKEDIIACAAAREEIRLRVLPRDHRWNAGRVLPSRHIRDKEVISDLMVFEHLANNQIVRRIVDRAFGFEHEEEEEEEVPEPGMGQCNWWPLHEIKSPHILWLTKGDSNEGEQLGGSINEVKELSDTPSILGVANIEKHWIHDILRREVFKYFKPLSSAVALSVGFLILIPYALS